MKRLRQLIFILVIGHSNSNLFSQSYPQFNVTAYDSIKSTGYYFFCPYKLSAFPTFPSGTQHHMILDSKGDVIYTRDIANYFAGDFKLQPNGLMSYCGDGYFYLMDSTFNVVDSITTGNGIEMDIHDLQILPNGHFLILGIENITMNLSSYHIFLGNGTPGSSNAVVKAFVVQELDSLKNVVFEWHAIDHFAFDDIDEFWLTDVSVVDWTHVNAVEMDADGNFLISSRHFNEITKISRADSSIIWRFGGKKNDFTFIGDSIKFLAQHDCRRQANGNLTLFDNGRSTNPLHYASAKEYMLDEVNQTATLVWSHIEGQDQFSRSQGNMQRLTNGNSLISYGNLVPTPIVFNVIDSLQNKIFEIIFPDSQITYRSYNFPSLPWQLNRPHITCDSIGSQHFLKADSGYSNYIWSTGDTTRSIPVHATGNYSVFVPIGRNGYISSEKFEVVNITNPCRLVSTGQPIPYSKINIYPNPASGFIVLSSTKEISSPYEIIDVLGRNLLSGQAEHSTQTLIDVSSLHPGFYIFKIGAYQKMFVKD